MKKIILAAAIVLTTGALTLITKDSNVKSNNTIKVSVALDKNVTATAD
jgi:hypothetical protein